MNNTLLQIDLKLLSVTQIIQQISNEIAHRVDDDDDDDGGGGDDDDDHVDDDDEKQTAIFDTITWKYIRIPGKQLITCSSKQ